MGQKAVDDDDDLGYLNDDVDEVVEGMIDRESMMEKRLEVEVEMNCSCCEWNRWKMT